MAMGRFESLTALALGRTPYESTALRNDDPLTEAGEHVSSRTQQYTENGHPSNPETRRRERENIRAANEVLQVTGVVEDAIAAKVQAEKDKQSRLEETRIGLRCLEFGSAMFVGGYWGVMGLRRRVLLYQPLSASGIRDLIRYEMNTQSVPSLLLSGMPAAITYHLLEYMQTFVHAVMDAVLDEDRPTGISSRGLWWRKLTMNIFDGVCFYTTSLLRVYSILQQLGLISGSRPLPSLWSMLPFSRHCPVRAAPLPASWNFRTTALFALATIIAEKPLLIVYMFKHAKQLTARVAYRPIYKALPHPLGLGLFSDDPADAPTEEQATPSLARERTTDRVHEVPTSHAATLRALEGLPVLERTQTQTHLVEHDTGDDSDGVAEDRPTETLLSFEYEASDAIDASNPPYAATLRSPEQPKASLSSQHF